MSQGLRERQKASRRARILEISRKEFQETGYSNVTIEDIASQSEVSAVTVYNYFGSKAGLLLALVAESDDLLIEKLERLAESEPDELIAAVLEFGRILRDHAMSYLQKPTWRQVISASISEGSREFGRKYEELDAVLIGIMERLIQSFQDRSLLARKLDARDLADCLFSIQNIRFFQFIADDSISTGEIDDKLHRDLVTLQQAFVGR